MTSAAQNGQDAVDVESLLSVLRAFKAGDFDVRLPDDREGAAGRVAGVVNDLIATTRHNAEELERVARLVGEEGRIEERLEATGGGGWARSVQVVNELIEDLVRADDEIAQVIGSVALGDLSQSVPLEVDGRPLRGHFATTARTVNTMVEQLSAFSSEVTRVAREVGTEGRLGGQARVVGVSGVWKDLTDSVNQMADNLTAQVRNIAEVTTAVANGDLSREITVEGQGEILRLKSTVNVMVDQLNTFAAEVTRVAHEVGNEGRLGGQAQVPGVSGVWKDLTDNVNQMAANLTAQVRNIAEVTTAVANGDLSREITVQGRGEILELKNTVNQMVDRLGAFASEVTRVAHEVGTEGKLGGQALVPGLAGTWGDLTDNVNVLAAQLTQQIRNIAEVTTAVARGDLSKKVTVDAQGEILDLKDTINVMVDQLSAFSSEVTRVAREVGIEGKLGGQAGVPDVAGVWKDLTENVNHLAATLTDQIRAIAEVATAVTAGDLTRSIGVEAFGEIAVLKDELNEMILNLRETTRRNTEQDWLKSHLADFNRMLQGHRDLGGLAQMILSELAPLVLAQQGAMFTVVEDGGREPVLRFQAGYAYSPGDRVPTFRLGEGLIGQCALEQRHIVLEGVPDSHFAIVSGLGVSPARSVIVLPVLFEGRTMAVIELASLQRFLPLHVDFLGQLTGSIGIVINTIQTNSRTEDLLVEAEAANRSKTAFLRMATHELRSPLATALGYLSLLKDGTFESPPQAWDKPLEVLNRKLGELARMVDDVLEVSRLEAGTVHPQPCPVDLVELAAAAAERAGSRPVERAGRFVVDTASAPAPVTALADPRHVARILDQLLDNALAYSDPVYEVRLRAYEEGTEAVVDVIDSGVGIDPALRDRVFEPFFRLDDPSRSTRPGTGLGLTIGAGLARCNGGRLIVARSGRGEGSCLRLVLPRAAAPEPDPDPVARLGAASSPASKS